MDDRVTEISISPKLICNNQKERIKVKHELERNLIECDSFDFSVAFVGESGISLIEQTLLDTINRKSFKGGRIITSTYLGFNTPKAFRFLLRVFRDSNVEIKIYKKDGFHPKGYIFKKDNDYKTIIGSSNLTQSALCENQEWNICLNGNSEDEVIRRVNNEFIEQWDDSEPLTEEWIKEYEKNYLPPLKYYVAKHGKKEFEPNKMQSEALDCLKKLREKGKKKALLISATGTGKTFLSAFDVKEFKAKKMLFVVHRETIARKAMETFKMVMPNINMGMFTGSEKTDDADFLFSTVNTMSKDEYLNKFKRDEFEYIVIDEVHRAGADMYKKIFKHFDPKFMLGMSATPERTDNPEKIYELFDYTVAYEIRLRQAMEYNLLCPFHYFGISDVEVNGEIIDDKAAFDKLVDDNRVEHILDVIDKYGYSGDKPHGLIFVSRKEEAYALSKKINEVSNFKTIALTGKDKDDFRRKSISLLEETNTNKDYLDFIITVDIFNEGIDIPCVNQVIMLRPTESAIIFIQQLGRGLRKVENKEYVTIIDIIGNYNNNFMIPLALSESKSGKKEALRKFIYDGDACLSGCSSVSFDQITKKRIFDSIDKTKLDSIIILRDEYQKLKARLANKIPSLLDFDKYSSIDPIVIFNAKKSSKAKGTGKFGSYYSFLVAEEPDYKIRLDNKEQEKFVNVVSLKFANGKRIHELVALQLLMNNTNDLLDELERKLSSEYGISTDDKVKVTIINEFTGEFYVGSDKENFNIPFIELKNGAYTTSNIFKECLNNNDFKTIINEIIEFGISRYIRDYKETYENTNFVLYQKYSYDDVFRLLNWQKSDVSFNVGGYKYNEFSNTFPVFINYDKSDASDTMKYKDNIINEKNMIAISKHPRNTKSEDAKMINNFKCNNTAIHMFVRKNNQDDFKEFYYLGLVEKNGDLEDSKMENGSDVFRIPYEFKTEIREDILSYLKS